MTWTVTQAAARIPEARVVSAMPPSKPRRVPWIATIYMIGPAVAGVLAALGIGAFFCAVLTNGRFGSPHLFVAPTEDVLSSLGMEWLAWAALVFGAAIAYQRRFLRRARVIEGVSTHGEITVTLEGREYRFESIAPVVPDGTRVPVFWHGSRIVELSKAGAALAGDGEVSWDAKAYPYGSIAAWAVAALAIVTTCVAMLVRLIVAIV